VKIITTNIPLNRTADGWNSLGTTIITGGKYGWLDSLDFLAMCVALP